MIPPDLMAAILEKPGDDAPRLASADWLDEHAGAVACGRCEGTGWTTYRTWHGPASEDDEFSTSSGRCDACRGTGAVPDGLADRAELIRVQCGIANLSDRDVCRHGLGRCGPTLECPGCNLRRRERELFTHQQPDPAGIHRMRRWAGPILEDFNQTLAPDSQSPAVLWRRGFPAVARCGLADWTEHAPALLAAHPLERVEVADVPGLRFYVLPPGTVVVPPSIAFTEWHIVGSVAYPGGMCFHYPELPDEAHCHVSSRHFPTRPALVAGTTAAVAEIAARLEAAAGDRWPGRRAEGREIGPLPEMWSGVGQGQCRQCHGTGSGVGNISSWCVVCRGTGFVPVSPPPADAAT